MLLSSMVILLKRAREPATQLIILEPSLSSFSSLPILRPSTADVMEAKMSVPTRERRVRIQDGLKWMFGSHAVGAVEELSKSDNLVSES